MWVVLFYNEIEGFRVTSFYPSFSTFSPHFVTCGEFFENYIQLCHNDSMEPSEFYEFEDRAYIQPTISSGEQEAFIDNLRNIQTQNNAQIAEQTYNLGTQVPSNLGGLGGGEAYFASRYQTPQVGEMVSTLKSAAQAQALNDVMNNYQAQLKQRYNQAYRSAQKRQREKANTPSNTPLPTTPNTDGNVNVITGDTPVNYEGLAFRQWQKDNGYDIFVNPQTVKNSGVPAEAIVAANEELKRVYAQSKQQSEKRNTALQPFYSGQLVL